MKKTKIKEYAEHLRDLTMIATGEYCESRKVKIVDKSFWAFLAIGFIGALELEGFKKQETRKIVELSQRLLAKE